MKIEKIRIDFLQENPENPRTINNDKMRKLVKSIREFPEMLEIRPVVVDKNNIVIGGNQRFRAALSAGLTEIPVIKADELTEEQRKQFIIKDNASMGEWDWEMVLEEWGEEQLKDWGIDLPDFNDNLTNNETYDGLDALSKLDKFMSAEVKRMFLVYDAETFAHVIKWFNKMQEKYNVEDNNQVILKMMEDENI